MRKNNLSDKDWKAIFIEDVAEIVSGRDIYEVERTEGLNPYVSSTAQTNGVSYFVGNSNHTLESECLSVNRNGSVGYSFYHPYKALFSNDCRKLRPHQKSEPVGIFLSNQIIQQRGKYNYGYKMGTARLRRQRVMLPVTGDGTPDWEFMAQFVHQRINASLTKYIRHIRGLLKTLTLRNIPKLSEKKWSEFSLREIFVEVQRGKRLTKANQIEGEIAYVSSTAFNNGVDNFIGNTSGVRVFSNCLTIANSGSVGSTFYHPYSFVASDHVTHLKNESFNRFVYLFVATQTSKLASKYNFNREINDKRISRDKVMLPTNERGEPDYDYMAQFMMNLEYKKRKKYLKYAKSKIVK